MGVASFDTIRRQVPASSNTTKNAYVECVAEAVLGAVVSENAPANWEVVVFEDASANAFALPGGKIGVHTGLLEVATNADQLAAVLGHEVGHVLAGHSNERVSQAQLTQFGLAVADVAVESGDPTPGQRNALALLGLGAHFGITLPYSRTHESEADLIGLDIMARAGFEPRASVTLWQNMSRGGAQTPEILSTHPSHATRISKLQSRIPSAEVLRDQAHAAGRRPSCAAP
jgi:predicted Zn-dependent protease